MTAASIYGPLTGRASGGLCFSAGGRGVACGPIFEEAVLPQIAQPARHVALHQQPLVVHARIASTARRCAAAPGPPAAVCAPRRSWPACAGAVCEAAVAGAEVVDAMGGEGEGEGEVSDSVSVGEEAEMAVDRDRVARLEIDGLGKAGEARGRNPASHSGVIGWPATLSQADSGLSKNGASGC